MRVADQLLWLYAPLISLLDYLMTPTDSGMQFRYPINVSKGAMGTYIYGLMLYFKNFSPGCWLYLSLHGTYGLVWLLKDTAFQDKTFRVKVSPVSLFVSLWVLGAYYVLPYLMVSGLGDQNPSPLKACFCVFLFICGVVLMIASDAQKNFTLRIKSGLISDGLYAHTRSPNYLGEVLLYLSFGICVNHKIGYWILGVIWSILFVTLILSKEKSLRRKQGWVDYERKSWIFLPKLIPSSDAASLALYVVLGIIVLRLT